MPEEVLIMAITLNKNLPNLIVVRPVAGFILCHTQRGIATI